MSDRFSSLLFSGSSQNHPRSFAPLPERRSSNRAGQCMQTTTLVTAIVGAGGALTLQQLAGLIPSVIQGLRQLTAPTSEPVESGSCVCHCNCTVRSRCDSGFGPNALSVRPSFRFGTSWSSPISSASAQEEGELEAIQL